MISELIEQPERWSPVPSFEGCYEVSDMGRIRSVRTGKLRRFFERAPVPYQAMYLQGNGLRKCILAHSLVLEVFRGPRPEGMVGRHLDGNARNNRWTNLRWGTPLENGADQKRHGRTGVGERNCKAKLTPANVSEIRASVLPAAQLASQFGVTPRTIFYVKGGSTWAHAT